MQNQTISLNSELNDKIFKEILKTGLRNILEIVKWLIMSLRHFVNYINNKC